MILVPHLNPKFATAFAARMCELRVRGTRHAHLQLRTILLGCRTGNRSMNPWYRIFAFPAPLQSMIFPENVTTCVIHSP